MERDLTSGSVFNKIIYFSLPYFLSYFLQNLYGMADLFIIGQFDGVDAITSVSIGSQIMHLVTVMIVGLAMGSTILIGRHIGENQKDKVSKSIGNTVALFVIMGIALMFILLMFINPIVSVMSTPEEAVSGTTTYLTICFIGIPFITAYNIISSIFRGLGDSKSPMYFIAVACVINIALDYLFIGIFDFGAAGAALATVLAQSASVLFALFVILKKKIGISLKKLDFKIDKNVMKQILKIGVPISFQDGFIQISFVIITIIVNLRGINDAAAVGVVEKIMTLIFLVPSSMMSAVSVLSAQNIGANKYDRASLTLKYATIICIVYGIIISILVDFIAETVVGTFSSEQYVIVLGSQYIRSYVWDCMFAGVHFCFSGYFCAYGMSEVSFIHNLISIILVRIPGTYLTSILFTDNLFPMGFASTTGSILSVIICVGVYVWLMKKRKREQFS